jgi:hypothetical protein
MVRRQIAALAFAVSVGLGLCHALCYSTLLPDQVASHFDATGAPAAWTSRSTMIDIQLTVITVLAAAFALLAGILIKSPARWFSLPNSQWWLAPERSDETRCDLACRILWLGTVTQIFVLDLFHHAVRVNLGRAPQLENVWPDVIGFLVLVGIWVGLILLRYARRPAAAS